MSILNAVEPMKNKTPANPTWLRIFVGSVIAVYVWPSNVPPLTLVATDAPPNRNDSAIRIPPAATNGIM
jgi:hypothetical protein